jgi:hypothetical protein
MTHILAFATTHRVLKAESLLKDSDIAFRLDPAPKTLTSFCELVITINHDMLSEALDVLKDNGLEVAAHYKLVEGEYIKL